MRLKNSPRDFFILSHRVVVVVVVVAAPVMILHPVFIVGAIDFTKFHQKMLNVTTVLI